MRIEAGCLSWFAQPMLKVVLVGKAAAWEVTARTHGHPSGPTDPAKTGPSKDLLIISGNK